jgi:hypothetical protein
MPRGDTKHLKINVRDSLKQLIDFDLDYIYLTVKKNFTDVEPKFQKSLSDGTITKSDDGVYRTVIMPADTDSLAYGRYVFDIEVIKGDKAAPTFKTTKVGEFIIENESTFDRNEG